MLQRNQMNQVNDRFASTQNATYGNRKMMMMKNPMKNQSTLYRKEGGNKDEKNFEYLDACHLELLDLNSNIQNMLPKPVKPILNLESVCKTSTNENIHKTSLLKNERIEKSVKHLYEMGAPQMIGTYIQPIQGNDTTNINTNPMLNCVNNPLMNGINANISIPSSPFFQPPNLAANFMGPTNSFLPFNMNMSNNNTMNPMNAMNPMNSINGMDDMNKTSSWYGLPSYVVPKSKPQSLTVTTIPNKDKDMLEKEAKNLKQLLNSSSQGIVNANPDYQSVLSSYWSNNNNSSQTLGSPFNQQNDKESDFSFGKQEQIDCMDQLDDELRGEYVEQPNSFNLSMNTVSYEEDYQYQPSNEFMNTNPNYTYGEAGYSGNSMKKEDAQKNDGLRNNENEELRNEEDAEKDEHGNVLGLEKKDSTSSIKKYEPSICFKNSKKYVNIRLGRPKKPYVTNSSDPIDKKLKDWHNTHNSQIVWKKNRRGVYSFGKTEVVLSLVHDKIVVKQIDGKPVKDNLLTVEKFVSLNELNELQREENENEELQQS